MICLVVHIQLLSFIVVEPKTQNSTGVTQTMLCGALIFLARPYAVVLTHLSSGASGAFSLVEDDLTVFPDY